MSDIIKAVEFICEPVKVQNVVSGAVRLTLDITPQYVDQAAWLLRQCGRTGVLLKAVVAIEEEPNIQKIVKQEKTSDMETGTKRKSQWSPPQA